MSIHEVLGIAFLWTGLWTAYDIVIVEKVFAPLNGWAYIRWYHWATWAFLFPVMTFVSFGVSWTFLVAILLFLGGWEDILYFWLQGKRVPRDIDWLPFTPNSTALYARALSMLGLSLATLTAVILWGPGL